MLRIEKDRDGGVTRLRLIGRIESALIGSIRSAISDCCAHKILDLSEVTLVDLGVVRFLNELRRRGRGDLFSAKGIVRPVTKDATTALGAAYAAGLAVGYFKDLNDLRANWAADRTWTPNLKNGKRDEMYNFGSWQSRAHLIG